MSPKKTKDDTVSQTEALRKQTEKQSQQINELKQENQSLKNEFARLTLDLQRTAQERDEAKNYFQAIFNHSGTVNIITNEDMTIDMSNIESRKRFSSDYRGRKSWMDHIHPEDLEMIKRYHAQRLMDPESAPRQFEYRLIGKSGNTRIIRVTSSVIPGTKKTMSAFHELTESRHLAENIRENELKYRTLFESSGDAILLIDGETVVDCNTKALQIFDCPREEILKTFGDNRERWFWPDLQPDGTTSVQKYQEAVKAARNGLYVPDSCKLRRFGGELFDADINQKIIHLNGKEYLMCIIRDISDLKRAEELYRTMADTSSAGVFIIQDGLFKFVNRAITENYGYRPDEIIGTDFPIFIYPDDRKISMKNAAAILRDGSTKPIEFRVLAKSGEVRYILATYAYITYEGRRAILGNCMDITELREIRSKFNDLQIQEKTILDTITHAVIGLQNRKIIFANPATQKIFGWSTEEILGQDISLFYRSCEEFLEFGKQIYSMLDKHPGYTVEIPLRHKDGGELFCLVNTTAIDRDVSTGRVVCVIEDITQRRETEEEKKKLEDQLIQSQKMEAVGTLAGGIAHDFNNLLMGIQGCISILKMEHPNNPQWSNRLKTIEDLVQSGSDLTRQLLGIARRGKYQLKTIDVNDLMDKTASLFARTKKEITIHRHFEDHIPPVDADRSQLEQMLLNLLVNAWQAMPGGGSIRLRTSGVYLTSEFVQAYGAIEGEYVKLTVEDTGIGMDAQTRERIFEPFFTTKEVGKGTGLGLAMVYGIVRGHRGIISVQSRPGQGTRFDIYLPASVNDPDDDCDHLQEIVEGKETILIVDDEEIIISVSRDILQMMGYRVYVARNGKEAVDIYAQQKDEIDLVIQDMIMPGMSGEEVFYRLKALNPAVKVILSSGYVIDRKIEDIMRKGCRAFIQKPFRTEELSGIIRKVLDEP